MNILLISFSGTGNTTICGDFIKEYFIKYGHSCEHYCVKENTPFDFDISQYDLVGFGYPIHAFNAPEAFIKFIKKLPKLAENKKYFIFKVSGEPFAPNNASSYHFYLKLKKKNFTLLAEKHFLMPYNIMFRYKDALAKEMYLYLKALTEAYVLEILNNDFEKIWYAPWHVAWSFLLRIEWLAPKLNSPFIKVKDDKCIKCNKCINECPCGAFVINKDGTYKVLARKCAMCMRCAMNCPKDAITYGFMNPWKVNGPFNYNLILNDSKINPDYINKNTKGYFKLFNKYYKKQNELLKKYHISNPIYDKN